MLSSDSRRTKRLCEFGNCSTSMCLIKFDFSFDFLFIFLFFLFYFSLFRITFITWPVFYGQMVPAPNQTTTIRQPVNRRHNRLNSNSQPYRKNNQKVSHKIKQHKMKLDPIKICRAVLLG